MSENHLRTISTTLSMLDEALGEFQLWAEGREARSILYRETNTLGPRQRRAIAAEVPAMRELLRQLGDDLHLVPREHDAACDIGARASLLWESLCELDAKHLRGYGEVPPELQAYLEPRVAELIRRLDRIASAARGDGNATLP